MSEPSGGIGGEHQGNVGPNNENDEAAENPYVEKIIGAVKGVTEQLKAQDGEQNPNTKWERRWRKREVWGIWAAAAVGLIAIIWSAIDSGHERGIMQRQLDEAEAQRLMNIAQSRARVEQLRPLILPLGVDGTPPKAGQKVTQFSINSMWKNAGNTDAVRMLYWFSVGKLEPAPKRRLRPSDCPKPKFVESNKERFSVTHAQEAFEKTATIIPIDEVRRAHSGKIAILMIERVEYRDVFPGTPTHHESICMQLVPNDVEANVWSPIRLRQDSD